MTSKKLNAHIARLFGLSDDVIEKMNGQVERLMIKTMRASLKDVQFELARMYEKHGESVTLGEMHRYKRLQGLEAEIRQHITETGKTLKKQITGNITDNLKVGYYHAGYAMETPVNINLGFTGLNPDVVRVSIINPYDAIKWSDALGNHLTDLNTQIRREITTGLIQGQGYAKTARGFRKKYEMATYKANRIVRTESHRAKSMGRNLAFDQSREAGEELGIEVKQIWDATLDSRTRGEHRSLDGKPAKIVDGEPTWSIGGITTSGPGLSGVASFEINCRCSTFTQVGDMSPDFRRDNLEKKEIQYMTYEEWAKKKGIPFRGEELLKRRKAA